MNREEVLGEELKKFAPSMAKEMSPEAVDVMMVLFHIGRLKDVGALEVETHTVTGNGFDLAMGLFDRGWEVDLVDIFTILNELFEEQDNIILTGLITKIQTMTSAEIRKLGEG